MSLIEISAHIIPAEIIELLDGKERWVGVVLKEGTVVLADRHDVAKALYPGPEKEERHAP